MTDQLALTRVLNNVFAAPVDAMLHVLGIQPANPAAPISDGLALELLIAILLFIFFIAVRASLSVEKPRPIQQIAEMIHEFTGSTGNEIIGHGYEKFQSFVTTIFLFVLTMNLIGLIPGINSPTENPIVPLGIAVTLFIFYNFHGFRAQGVKGYLGHFAGPIWQISPLLFPIEIISNFARVMSLTIRLYANMFAGGLVTLVFFSLIPLFIPVAFLGLHLVVSLIQAYVFMLLAMIYLSEAVTVSHDH